MTAARLLAMSRAGRSSDQVSSDDHDLLRLVGSLQFAIGGLLLLVVLLLPDPDRSDHGPLTLLAAIGLFGAVARWSSHRDANVVARAWNVGCIVFVAAIVAVSRPVGPAAFLMLWPVLSTAYFLGRRDLVGMLALMTTSLLVALRLNPDPSTDPLVQLTGAVSIIGSASVLMVLLRERVDGLITDLERTASTDGLTGLANRTAWNTAFETEIERARRSGAPLSMAIFDLDRFKAINDCLGHAEGDRALVRFSNLLATECRSFDIPAGSVARSSGSCWWARTQMGRARSPSACAAGSSS